ncbi:MAG: ribosome maturation factor RimP [Christensenellaceae bacterium]|nr:ribosome maturation factor RimP [Christensenellaceae bacterium]
MSKKIESSVEAVVAPIIEQLGYELVDVEFVSRKGADSELVITIDKPGGVDLDDCEKVSRAIDEPMDEADPITESYVLCVSSPGLDRPLKKDRDLERSIGKMVDIKLYQKQNGKKELTAMLKGFDEQTIFVVDKKENVTELKRSDIAMIRLHIDF